MAGASGVFEGSFKAGDAAGKTLVLGLGRLSDFIVGSGEPVNWTVVLGGSPTTADGATAGGFTGGCDAGEGGTEDGGDGDLFSG